MSKVRCLVTAVACGSVGCNVAVEASDCTVRLPMALGDQEIPLSFHVNTVPTRVLSLVPGISESDVETIAQIRGELPFVDFGDFQRRGKLRPEILDQLKPLDLTE